MYRRAKTVDELVAESATYERALRKKDLLQAEVLEQQPLEEAREQLTEDDGKILRLPLLTADEEQILAAAVAEGDERARDVLVVRNLRLIHKRVNRYMNDPEKHATALYGAYVGLIEAATKYRPGIVHEKGRWKGHVVRFASYAAPKIDRAIYKAMREDTWYGYDSQYVLRRRASLGKKLCPVHGVPTMHAAFPAPGSGSKKTCNCEICKEYRELCPRLVPAEIQMPDGGWFPVIDMYAASDIEGYPTELTRITGEDRSSREDPDDHGPVRVSIYGRDDKILERIDAEDEFDADRADEQESKVDPALVEQALDAAGLTTMERKVYRMRHGLNGTGRPMRTKEIAELLDRSDDRIRQLVSRANRKVRRVKERREKEAANGHGIIDRKRGTLRTDVYDRVTGRQYRAGIGAYDQDGNPLEEIMSEEKEKQTLEELLEQPPKHPLQDLLDELESSAIDNDEWLAAVAPVEAKRRQAEAQKAEQKL